LSAKEVSATAQEMQPIDEGEAEEEVLSRTIETALATTRAGRKRRLIPKVVDNAIQAHDTKRAKTSGCGGRGSGRKV
jgi:hypothetical protein